jgi:hypothetical protein
VGKNIWIIELYTSLTVVSSVAPHPPTMGCCSKSLIVAGCCCCNAVLECPPKLGCADECEMCCCECKACLALGDAPLPWCCCGPTCVCNATLFKLKATMFCLACQGSFPCGDDTPIICSLLPFCTAYPKMSCCDTTDSVVKMPVTVEGGNQGGPPQETMRR